MESKNLEGKLATIAEVMPNDIRNAHILKRWVIKLIVPDGNLDAHLLSEAIDLGVYAHEGQRRESGRPYIVHPFQVGYILAYIGADSQTVAGGILHDSVEDTSGERRAEIITRIYNLDHKVLNLVLQVSDIPNYNGILRLINNPDLTSLLSRFKREEPSKDHRVAAIEVADNISNISTLDGLKSSNGMSAEERRLQSIQIARSRILPLARIVDETYSPFLKFYDYMSELIAREEAKFDAKKNRIIISF